MSDSTIHLSPSDQERFLARVPVSTEPGCWNWTGAKDAYGYGAIVIGGKTLKAHRVMYELFIGPIPPRHVVMHSCDNPSCVNPLHLWAGTQADNMREAAGRRRWTRRT